MVTLENGGIVKSIHGGLYKDSIWYSVYGSKGRMECPREDAKADHISRIYVNYDEFSGEYAGEKLENYMPKREFDDIAANFGHGNSDFYSMYNFVEKALGNEEADIIDIYEALDMFLPGMFAYRSILKGSIPMQIPDLRDKAVREEYRNDVACTYPEVAGDQLLPTRLGGTPEFDKAVYDHMLDLWNAEVTGEKESTYKKAVFNQGKQK